MIPRRNYDQIALLENTPTQAESQLHCLKQAAWSIDLYANAFKRGYVGFNQKGDIHTIGRFSNISVSGTSVAASHWLKVKAICCLVSHWLLLICSLSYWILTDMMKWNFFQARVSSLLHVSTDWTPTKCIEEKLHGSGKKIRGEILKKSWKQHNTKH